MTQFLEDKRFYVYIYLNPLKSGNFQYQEFCFSHSPFYIGKGSGRRLIMHLYEAEKILQIIEDESIDIEKEKYNKHKINTINKIHRFNKEVIIFKIEENMTTYDAGELEKYLIKIIGRNDLSLGPLTNLTDGGEGSTNISEESRKKQIEKQKETINDPTWKATIGKEGAKKRSKILKEKYESGEMSPANKGLTKENSDIVKKCTENMLKTRNDPVWLAIKGVQMIENRKKTMEENNIQKGEDHPFYGKNFTWYTNGKENKLCFENDFKKEKELISKGFYIGHTANTSEEAKQNRSKAQKETPYNKGKYHPRSKKIINLTLNKIFDCISDAKNFYEYKNCSIYNCCKGLRKTCTKGYHWAYYNE